MPEPGLVVGPVLRYVDESRATLWVEADHQCMITVKVEGGPHAEAPTWTVHGHHYALLVVEGLAPGSVYPYEVLLDGAQAWPPGQTPYPPSVIRTFGGSETFRLAFGSCRRVASFDQDGLRRYGADALAATAEAMAATPYDLWPDALLMVGDQVYADDPSEEMERRLRAHGTDRHPDVAGEASNFEEYTWLYQESWTVPAVRWLLSTVPTCMILDDHDLRDDWNASWSWRQQVTSTPWWRERVIGAFASYWIYQHLGNLAPEDLGGDEVYAAILTAADEATRGAILDEHAWRSDAEPESTRWSFVRDFGRSRLVVVDSRCSRRLDPDDRAMIDEREWEWVVDHVHADVDHLLIGTTLPYLLLPGVHDLEGWNEAVAGGGWGRAYAWLAEHVRQAIDLEHWAAFRTSFEAMTDLLRDLARGSRTGSSPSTVLVLSGDVHCSYLAEAHVPGVDPARTRVHQLVQSPYRNPLGRALRAAFTTFGTRTADRVLRALARRAGVRDVPISWKIDHGPWFDNGITTVELAGRQARVEVERAVVHGGRQVLETVIEVALHPQPERSAPGHTLRSGRAGDSGRHRRRDAPVER